MSTATAHRGLAFPVTVIAAAAATVAKSIPDPGVAAVAACTALGSVTLLLVGWVQPWLLHHARGARR